MQCLVQCVVQYYLHFGWMSLSGQYIIGTGMLIMVFTWPYILLDGISNVTQASVKYFDKPHFNCTLTPQNINHHCFERTLLHTLGSTPLLSCARIQRNTAGWWIPVNLLNFEDAWLCGKRSHVSIILVRLCLAVVHFILGVGIMHAKNRI